MARDCYTLGKNAAAHGEPAEAVAVRYKLVGTNLSRFLDGFGVRSNPARETLFDRCVRAVKERGSAYDPKAVCATAGRRKYGQAEMTRRAVAGKRRAARARGNPGRKGFLVGGSNWISDSAYAKRLAKDWADSTQREVKVQTVDERGDIGRTIYTAKPHKAGGLQKSNPTVQVRPSSRFKGRWEVGVPGYPVIYRKSKRGAISWANAIVKAKGGEVAVRDNPAADAVEAYTRFHGQAPTDYVKVTKRIHYHENLWGVGKLHTLKIRAVNGRSLVTLKGFRGTILAANEQAFKDLVKEGQAHLTQLFIEGGDQTVDLRSFGIDSKHEHEVETLGKATFIGYHTVKVHLGSEGGDAVYGHKFGTTRQGDKHIKIRVARYPEVIYRVLDKQLEFSGGSYEIRAEGIDK